eukprot:2801123-Lingulodinium_polyedra.AAC.1
MRAQTRKRTNTRASECTRTRARAHAHARAIATLSAPGVRHGYRRAENVLVPWLIYPESAGAVAFVFVVTRELVLQ